MIADVPAFTFSLDAGPATASLEFVVGVIGNGQSTWARLETEPCWVVLENRMPPHSSFVSKHVSTMCGRILRKAKRNLRGR